MYEDSMIKRLKEIEASIPHEWAGESARTGDAGMYDPRYKVALRDLIRELEEEGLPGFLLTAYRSDGADYCRGCIMGSSSSDYETITSRDENEIADKWAALLHFNETKGREYASYEFTLYLNGRQLWEGDDEYELVRSLANEKLSQLLAEDKRRKEAEERKKAEDAQRAREAADQKKLRELINQYGVPADNEKD